MLTQKKIDDILRKIPTNQRFTAQLILSAVAEELSALQPAGEEAIVEEADAEKPEETPQRKRRAK